VRQQAADAPHDPLQRYPTLALSTDASRSTSFDGDMRTDLERDLRDLSVVQSLPDLRRRMRAAALRAGNS